MPLDPDRCRKWVKAIGQEDLLYLPIEKLNVLKFVCNEHFQPEDFNKSRSRLLSHAVPTLNLPLKPLEDKMFQDFPLHIGQYPKQGSTELLGSKVEQDVNAAQPVPSTSTQSICFVQTYQQQENINVLQDVTNLESEALKTGIALKRKENILDPSVEPGPSCAEISVQGYKRQRRSHEAKGLSGREEKLLLKLKAQKLTIKKLANTSLDLDKIENTILKDLVRDVAKNYKKKPPGKGWTMKTKLWALALFKRSKAYRYLGWAMAVPSVKTLQRLLQSVPVQPGINKKNILKCYEMLSGLSEEDKFCALLFDEMSLKKGSI